jgi:hypothetical protein
MTAKINGSEVGRRREKDGTVRQAEQPSFEL